MRIGFYAPFKPLGHANPSGDLVIATGLVSFLRRHDHTVWPASPLRTRWIYWKPLLWLQLIKEYRRICRQIPRKGTDVWLTYHTYYKAPDLLGPLISRRAEIPYIIFQGIFSTKRRRDPKTWPGFMLNKRALCRADHIFTNRQEDLLNLRRLVPENRLTYVAPGIYPEQFRFDEGERKRLRRLWNIKGTPVILSAAMFRPDVKTEGITWVIKSCGRLHKEGKPFILVIIGDGRRRAYLESLATRVLPPEKFIFTGKIAREEMYSFYSAGDIFAFPGINESLGMVFLEAQCCKLPVLAFKNGGIPEVVRENETGFLTPLFDEKAFDMALERLISDDNLRKTMGSRAKHNILKHHDLNKNYKKMEKKLQELARK